MFKCTLITPKHQKIICSYEKRAYLRIGNTKQTFNNKTSKAMENHKDISLSEVREIIIRYGAKYMERYESDLYYDCNSVGKMQPGDTIFWMVSGTHTHMYTAKEMHDHHIGVDLVGGNRFNYRIDCKASRYGANQFDMTQVYDMEIQKAVNDIAEEEEE